MRLRRWHKVPPTYDHGRHGDTGDQGNPERGPHQRSQLPQELLFARPWLLAPEGAAGRAQVVQIADLLHAQPAELGPADGTDHVVAGTVVHLDDQHLAPGTWLDVVLCTKKGEGENSC